MGIDITPTIPDGRRITDSTVTEADFERSIAEVSRALRELDPDDPDRGPWGRYWLRLTKCLHVKRHRLEITPEVLREDDE
jgi:hypothetical protein